MTHLNNDRMGRLLVVLLSLGSLFLLYAVHTP